MFLSEGLWNLQSQSLPALLWERSSAIASLRVSLQSHLSTSSNKAFRVPLIERDYRNRYRSEIAMSMTLRPQPNTSELTKPVKTYNGFANFRLNHCFSVLTSMVWLVSSSSSRPCICNSGDPPLHHNNGFCSENCWGENRKDTPKQMRNLAEFELKKSQIFTLERQRETI